MANLGPPPRVATVGDAAEIARLLHDFNTEFDTPTPGVEVLALRLRNLLSGDATFAVLAGDPAVALALATLRPWLDGYTFKTDNTYFLWGAILILALWGVVISAVYMLRAYRAIFMGEPAAGSTLRAGPASRCRERAASAAPSCSRSTSAGGAPPARTPARRAPAAPARRDRATR